MSSLLCLHRGMHQCSKQMPESIMKLQCTPKFSRKAMQSLCGAASYLFNAGPKWLDDLNLVYSEASF
eukprot:4594625-Amphidinium_carterae.1